MISVIISTEDVKDGKVNIRDIKDINHIKNVFRSKIGDDIRAVDGIKEYFCTIGTMSKDIIVLKVISEKIHTTSYETKIHMGISLIKNDKMDMDIQKLTELGVDSIIPLITRRVIVKIKDEKEEKKIDKWYSIAKETLKQCQGITLPKICAPQKLYDLDLTKYDLIIVPYECEKENSLKALTRNIPKAPNDILIIIGPEGGFEPEEITYLKNKGAKIVTLGDRILRAETAAIVTGGIISNEYR